jgi:hypothetical protein
MTFLRLKPDVSFGFVGEHPVFLDLKEDRYLALDASTEAAFARAQAASGNMPPDGQDVERLLRTGLFQKADRAGALTATSISVPDCGLLSEMTRRSVGLVPSVRVWTNVARARRRLRTVPLIKLVANIRDVRQSGASAGTPGEAEKAAETYLVARALVPVNRSCLLDCLGLVDWLGDRARHATLVFGVRMDPFGAHCWLQTDRAILTDAPDTVRNFAPVLVV